jgi:hypothetical protein
MMTAMNILKTTMACLLGLSLAACTADVADNTSGDFYLLNGCELEWSCQDTTP